LKSNLYIVDGPLQLLNAIEAKTKFAVQGDHNILVIRYLIGEVNKRQVINCLKLSTWNQVIEIRPFLLNFSTYVKTLLLVKSLKKKESLKVRYLFIGGFFYQANHFFKINLNPEYSFLLDDGSASIKVQEEMGNRIKIQDLSKGRAQWFLKKLISQFLGLKLPTYLRYDFFTFFQLVEVIGQERVRNEFLFLGEKFSKKEFNEEKVFFLGAPLVEIKIVSADNYWNSVLQIQEYYFSKNKEFIYVMHRREVQSSSGHIEGLGIRFVSFDNPIELELLFHDNFPRSIGSFYSSALMSLHQLYNGLDIRSFRLKKEFISDEYQSNIESIYEYYSSYIEVVELN
jgi:hypothetical protein